MLGLREAGLGDSQVALRGQEVEKRTFAGALLTAKLGFTRLSAPIDGTVDATVQALSRDSADLGTAEKSAGTQQQGVSPQQADTSPIPKTQNLVFPVTLTLSRASPAVDGVMVPLTPGMTVTVEVKTEQRRVIDFLLSPLRQTVSETAHER